MKSIKENLKNTNISILETVQKFQSEFGGVKGIKSNFLGNLMQKSTTESPYNVFFWNLST